MEIFSLASSTVLSFQQGVRRDKQTTKEDRPSQRHFFLPWLWIHKLHPSQAASSLWDVRKGLCREAEERNTLKSQRGPEEDDMGVRASIPSLGQRLLGNFLFIEWFFKERERAIISCLPFKVSSHSLLPPSKDGGISL